MIKIMTKVGIFITPQHSVPAISREFNDQRILELKVCKIPGQLMAILFAQVKVLSRTRYKIGAILIDWDASKWPGILLIKL